MVSPNTLTPEQQESLAGLRSLLRRAEPESVQQGLELALALADPLLLARLDTVCQVDAAGDLLYWPPGVSTVAPRGRCPTVTLLRFVLELVRLGYRAAPSRLRLSFCAEGNALAAVLSEHESLHALEHLDLAYTQLDDEGLRQLAQRKDFPSLRVLSLRHNLVTPLGLEALLRAPWLATLDELDLREHAWGLAGARSLGQAPALRGVKALWLRYEDLGPEGAAWMAQAPALSVQSRAVWRARCAARGAE